MQGHVHPAAGAGSGKAAPAVTPAAETPTDKTVYICPMNCVPPMEKPGRCPVCGMDLVPTAATAHAHEDHSSRLNLAPDAVRAAGIQVATVKRMPVTREIRLFGRIAYDPVSEYKVTAFAPGVIDKIYVKRAGQTVRAGDALFDLHSSELYYLEQELFAALERLPYRIDARPTRGQRFKRWVRPWMSPAQPAKPGKASAISKDEAQAVMAEVSQIRRKMRLLGLAETDIDRIIARGSPSGISTVTTPMGGVVLEQYAFKGSYLNTGEAVFTIADPQYIWAQFDAYESDFPWIRLGQAAEFSSDAYPGETFIGKIIYLDPYFNEKTRTFKVGVLCTDHRDKLKPAMLVRGSIHADLSAGYREDSNKGPASRETPPLVIPESAPLITGTRAVVYMALPGMPGTYEGREISLGPRATGYYVVRDGLREGESVVVNGNFKIDSAVQILAQASMMQPAGDGAMPMGHHHGTGQVMQHRTASGMPAAMQPMDDRTAGGMAMATDTAANTWGSRTRQIEALRHAIRDGRSRAAAMGGPGE